MRVLRPLQPAAVLIALAVVLIAAITIVRAVSAAAGFLVERQVVLILWIAGLLMAGAVFAWVVRRSLRADATRSGLLLMTLTVLLLASPLALMLLQHPAP
ncbi:MAG TPA: hypothetical protein VHK65_15960 [Candidatus Dormibacteraeota bacterium]|nr:hypothetical protein [Candidatus Dormibacteraeota bacterium]